MKLAWISSDYFELFRGENDSKQSDEFQATCETVLDLPCTHISLSRWKFARKGWQFITSHLRFTLASIQNRAKNEAPKEEAGTRQGRNENIYVSNAWFNWTCYDPPGQPRGQIQPLGQGEAELFEMALSRVVGGGANKK